MASRRGFLRAAGIAAAASVSGGFSSQLAQAQERPAASPTAAPLPPSIAALKSMKDQAVPITVEERRARIENARRLMTENRLDALMMTGGTSLVYFTNLHWGGGERLFTLILPAKGEPFYVCPAFERDRAEEQITQGPLGPGAEIRIWQEDESPYERVAQGLKDRGLAGGRLGMEERVEFVFSNGVARAAPALEIVSGTPVTAGCRMHKSDHEIALMRLAAQVTITAYEAAWRALEPGMTQRQLQQLIGAAYERLGFPGEVSVNVGTYSALPHGSRQPQTIHEGEIVMIDDGCLVEGYTSDITRTFVLGKVPDAKIDKMRQVFDIVHRAQKAALATARPGIEAQEVDAAARKVIVDAGYGPGYTFFTHRVGHGMGMDGHEWPYLVRGDTVKLAPNMMFSDEPGIYIHGEFGVRLEDDMHITENGAELFSGQSASLEQPFTKG
ncbi:MAG TPA: Xaa-Pro peptidase family protein [Terriglobia bacterium]|nr:Xaa-Pro peptidase family protein [Terriglobia bacterium]